MLDSMTMRASPPTTATAMFVSAVAYEYAYASLAAIGVSASPSTRDEAGTSKSSPFHVSERSEAYISLYVPIMRDASVMEEWKT